MRWSPSLLLVLLLCVAAGVRFGLLVAEWPASNSDEGTMGLMAMHIAQGRDFPSFMYGQSYMGTAEAYLAALIFRVFGASLIALRTAMLLMYLLFLATMYVLARRLYGTTIALVSVALLTLGSRELYGHQLVAQGAIPETLLAGTLLLLLAHRLLDTTHDTSHPHAHRWRLAGWGATATLGLWSTVLIAPFVLTSAVLVWMSLRRRTTPIPGSWPALAAGLLTGAIPWILHDLSRPWHDSGILAVINMYLHGGTGLNGAASPGLTTQVINTVTTSLSYVTGGSALAHPNSPPAWFFGMSGSWHPPTDDLVSTLWGIALIVLWSIGLVTGIRLLRHHRATTAQQPTADMPTQAQTWARLAMLTAAALTVLAFAASPTPGVAPANNFRYIIGVLIATPAVIAPLWALPAIPPRAGALLRTAVLTLTAITLTLGTVQAYRDAGQGPTETPRRQLINALHHEGITHIYSGYLECNRLTFLSNEHITCAVLFGSPTDGLHPGLDRYQPYRTAVQADPHATYVFRTTDTRNTVLAHSTCQWQKHWNLNGYHVWQPAQRCPIPAEHGR
ncbi:ArnT family glycosyltransferase [Actinoplanes sp. NPDC049681]|uniref:ArnT family glycosyltransferase n=1 Tax=Actinoplanes sp. NPDC049681 TaxID=3363905 RepID=UPI00378EC7DE